jgi:hypothetical protein
MIEPTVIDQRVLGDEDFVAKVKGELFSHKKEKSFNFRETQERIRSIVEAICREGRVQPQELPRGSGRQQVAEVCA